MFRKREFELEKFQPTKFENMFDNIEEIQNPNITERHTSKDSGIEYDEKVYPAKPNLGKSRVSFQMVKKDSAIEIAI